MTFDDVGILAGAYLALVAALALLAAAGIRCAPAVLAGVVVAEVLMVIEAVVDLGLLADGHRPGEPAVHLGYVAVSVILLPLLVGRRGVSDRVGCAVVAFACVVTGVVVGRLHATWG